VQRCNLAQIFSAKIIECVHSDRSQRARGWRTNARQFG